MTFMPYRALLQVAVISLLFIILPSYATQQVKVYAYHLKPPYLIDVEEEKGLYFDVTELLNRFQPMIRFKLEYMPRKRLNRDIEQNTLDGLIMGVSPVWFRDREQTKLAWSNAFMNDRDEFVSHVKTPFEFAGPSSLYSKTIGGIRGYYYFQVAPVVTLEKATLVETGTELQLLEMVVKQRLDVAVISRATVNYLVAQKKHWQNDIHFSQRPHEFYSRAIVATKSMQAVIDTINNLMRDPLFDKALNKLLADYHITDKDLEIVR
ncbi:transporter substrate-binding domain-containing protein [Pseudoalteromonas sp. JBTF-M23]|uniref:Transporter substrate-binding domain-containing protein n=1 Tax=Pseudoalteromonas caenipelagi TaxID=2726988 RepID=A0A849VCB3_9GAMM|nr:transporter substrate-binding domain-containing protein [Pseudoalteromonas caenipelagi]NOU50926.1 transporter substrate-binding domain-containing protein [Pseudoalteromonas caenipelagi]